ncbi:hypothetical protein [Fusobacterium hominis]|uniref:Uncharacterized protein n=1 Tax=Fusobacterium hominis TaxID=2764326 RepID=A0A7G9GXJ7_9FUSO|nr:hypothetical protein [Fusobacterium hominis]QNM15529.1 hypothetical protein H9Q81_01425 [Fusobacterium hominis]
MFSTFDQNKITNASTEDVFSAILLFNNGSFNAVVIKGYNFHSILLFYYEIKYIGYWDLNSKIIFKEI